MADTSPSLNEQVRLFRERPLAGSYPYLWLNAKVEEVREPGSVRSKALVVAQGVHETGGREIIGSDVGKAEIKGLLARVPALAAGAQARRRADVHLRRPRGPEERDRQDARLPLAALHRTLPA